MTALFATAETYTASTALGATLTSAPAELAVLPAASARGGAAVPVAGAVQALSPLAAATGAHIGFAAVELALLSAMPASAGAVVALAPLDYVLQVDPFAAPAGGMAALVTDEVALEQPPTASFSTAAGDWPQTIIRVPHAMAVVHQLAGRAGARAPVEAVLQSQPDEHGPVARPRAVQAQIVMS